jgi:light-harvesting protein B-800-850 alpha chain
VTAALVAGPAVEELEIAALITNETPSYLARSAEMPSIATHAEDSVLAVTPEPAEAAGLLEAAPAAAQAAAPAAAQAAAQAAPAAAQAAAPAAQAAAPAAPEAAPVQVEAAFESPAGEIDWPKEDRAPRRVAAPVPAGQPAPIATFAEPAEPGYVLEAEPVAVAAQEDEPLAVGVMEGAFDTASMGDALSEAEREATGDELLASADHADQAGDDEKLRSLLVLTARAYGREGRFEAGLDAMHRVLQRDPGNVEAHIELVELYVARGWNSLAAEKLVLLGRLAELDDDKETRQRLCAVASRAFPDNQHLASLCA